MKLDSNILGVSTQIWQNFKIAKANQAAIIRSGCGSYGSYSYDPNNPFDFSRSESDAEHVFGTLVLFTQVNEFYPSLINQANYFRAINCLLYHEMGENMFGDIQDNGNRNESKKNMDEQNYLIDYMKDWSTFHRTQICNTFVEMQDKSTTLGSLLYLIDKTEVILQNLIYEDQGRGGDAKNCPYLTPRDQMEINETGSTKPADMWSYGLYTKYCKKDSPHRELFRIFLNIIRAGARDVRGKDLSWIETS